MKAIILISEASLSLAQAIQREMPEFSIFFKGQCEGCESIASIGDFVSHRGREFDSLVFIGAMGICVRSITPIVNDKHSDPAVVCVDSTGRYVIPVLSGHIGGANDLSRRLASILGAEAVITTQSDNEGLWALDTLASRYGWKTSLSDSQMNEIISLFVRKRPTALVLEARDRGTDYLQDNLPEHVTLFHSFDELPEEGFELVIAVSPRLFEASALGVPVLSFFPPVLHLGVGCRKDCDPVGVAEHICSVMTEAGLSSLSVASISTIELKAKEALVQSLVEAWPDSQRIIYSAQQLSGVEVPNPSQKAFEVTGVYGVAEAAALVSASEGPLLIEKQKAKLSEGNDFTFAVALDRSVCRLGHIEIVGAGPGDPELVSVRGKRFLQNADLILYAGSLVPVELTYYAKPGAVVRSSASLDLEQQFALMKEFYDRGCLVVRLHTGDPCIYGAIQEQMAFFDQYEMSYHITPGISSFQAAAAALRSQFTIPEKVQSIILTRGEGRTPMPEKEQLHLLAKSQSTMCIYLSAGIVEQVQAELMQEYPPETPVAACYKLTWKEEKIYRGQLKDLANIVRDNKLTLTTLLVVGEAIDNRRGLSRLYAHEFKHLFRK